MKTSISILSAASLVAALGAQQGAEDQHGTPHVATPAVEPTGGAGPDSANAAPARGGSPLAAFNQASPIHTAASDSGFDYGIWACGAHYKVSFHDGMTFVPYLGADYPHNQPVSWTTRSVRIGATELANGKIVPNQAEYRYEYDLGDVTEAYDVLAEGLEQTFVIDQRPVGARGDLVVEGKIESMLTAAAAKAAHQDIDFFDANGEKIFNYGAAFAVDANGVKVPMTTGYADGVITLSLSGQTLETLAFPVTVDPLLGNVSLRTAATWNLNAGMDCLREDEATSNNVWHSYSRAVSATDDDLWLWRNDENWAGADLAAFQDLTTSWGTTEPQIASVSGANCTITVFTREFSTGQTRVRYHIHPYADTTLLTNVGGMSPPSGESNGRPDVGGTYAFSSGTVAMVVYQQDASSTGGNTAESYVVTRTVDCDAALGPNGSVGTPSTLAQITGRDIERPRINQQSEGGSSPVWAVVYQEYNNGITGDDWDVYLEVIDNTGAPVRSRTFTEGGGSNHKLGPVVAGQSGRYSVQYSIAPLASVNFKTSLTTGFDIRVRRLDFDGTNFSWGSLLSSLGDMGLTTGSRRWVPGGIAYDTDTDSHWLSSFLSTSSGSTYCALTGYRGGYILRETILSTSAGDALLGGVSFDDDSDDYYVLVGDNGDTSLPTVGDVWEYVSATSEVSSGTSCSSASLSWSGAGNIDQEHAIGNEFCSINVSGAGAGDIHFMVLSLAPRNALVIGPAVAPGCRLLVQNTGPDYLGVLDFRIGSSVSWDQSIPEFLAADTVYFQDWIFDGSLFRSTQRMEVQIVK